MATTEKSRSDASRARRSFVLRVVLPAVLAVVLFILATFLLLIPAVENQMLEGKKETTQELTRSAISIIDEYYREEVSGTRTREQAQAEAKVRIEQLRWGDEGKDYFWITDMHPTMIMHPYLPELDGLLVHFAYSERGWMGYSPAARAAYIREAGGKKGLSLFPDCESNAGVGWACAKTRASCDSGPAAPRHPAGSRRADVLLGDDDRVRYRDLLQEYSERYGLTVLAYCLMTNHVHLVAVPRDEGLLSQVSKLAGRELVVRGRSRPRKPEEGDER